MHIGKIIAKKSFEKKEFIASYRCDNCQIAIQIFFFRGDLLIAERITHESFKIEM